MAEKQKFVTPIGELVWVFINGEGREDLQGNKRYSAALRLKDDSPELAEVKATIAKYWNDNHPAKVDKANSTGVRQELDKSTGKDVPTGYTLVNFWTGVEYPDGSTKNIVVKNAKNQEVALGKQMIGNGSKGRISGVMNVYYTEKTKLAGVALYLDAIQLTKFVSYSADDGFEAVDDSDGWTGETDDGLAPAEADVNI